ncbi:MAG TPA: S8 family serine peptidase [Planctomycetota bacterium]|nr:S8 family serine peptidase [Planctomycetota bacterium]
MHRSVVLAVLAGAVVSLSAQSLPPVLHTGGFVNGNAPRAMTPDRVIVRFRGAVDEATLGELASAAGIKLVDRGSHGEFYVFRCAPALVDAMVTWFGDQAGVEYAERDALAHTTVAPSDSYWSYQWSLFNQGSASGTSVSNYGVRAEAAWANGATGAGVVVAVVDTGVAYENFGSFVAAPDLVGRTFVAPYDAVANDGHANDENSHGTHVAGTIGQVTNNGIGCAGIARDCTIMPVRVLNASGSGSYTQIANGLAHAVANNAKVVNMSLGGGSGSTTLQNAVINAANAGLILCAAAGNTGRRGVQYPAIYTQCIAVGATRFDGTKPRYGSYGPGLDVVAPGGDTSVDQNHDGYADGILQQTFASGSPASFGYYFFQGTSMATPHVAAIAALVWQVHPTWTAAQVRARIESTATDLGAAGYDQTFGNGLVNAQLAAQ